MEVTTLINLLFQNSNEIIRLVFLIALSIVNFISFIGIVVSKENRVENRSNYLQKIFGSSLVFLIAVLSNNPWIYFTSLFIGGLIIATEDFLSRIAIIMRSESKDIKNNLNWTPATALEIEEKETLELEGTNQTNEDNTNVPVMNMSESEFLDYIEQCRLLPGEKMIRGVKLDNKAGFNFIADAITTYSGGYGNPSRIIEIKKYDPRTLERYFAYTIEKLIDSRTLLEYDTLLEIYFIASQELNPSYIDTIKRHYESFGFKNKNIRAYIYVESGNSLSCQWDSTVDAC